MEVLTCYRAEDTGTEKEAAAPQTMVVVAFWFSCGLRRKQQSYIASQTALGPGWAVLVLYKTILQLGWAASSSVFCVFL